MRALLIGSGYAGLPVEASVDAVSTWLRAHEFAAADIERLSGTQATRDAMLHALARLAAIPVDAPVVVYYAGHGQRFLTELGATREGHMAYPLLVTIDVESSGAGTLRSVLGSELSRALQLVARRTRNLTVILDCCHASGMLRLDDPQGDPSIHAEESALHSEASARIARQTPRVLRSGADIKPPERLSERVVVLAASSAGGRAYTDPTTKRLLFTDALLAALSELAPDATWDDVLVATRARVQSVYPGQCPALFGPRFRRPLGLDEQLPTGELFRVEQRSDRTILLAGDRAGIHPNDRFELTTFATTSPTPAAILGIAHPFAIHGEHTWLQTPTAVRIPQPCHARRIRRGEPPRVAITCADPDLTATLTRIAEAASFSVGDHEPTAHLELHAGVLHVRDCLGELVHAIDVRQLSAEPLRRCLRRLDLWRGTARWLRADSSACPLRHAYALRWGPAVTRERTGEPVVLGPGDALTLELENLDRGAPELYMHAFRVRADREIRGWNSETGAQYAAAYQQTRAGRPGGAGKYTHSLDAPPDLPPGRYHEWTLVIVADQSFDIDLLETPIDARGLTTGFDRGFGPGKRGPSDQRRFDIVGFPYTLQLP